MASISQIKLPNAVTYNIKDKELWDIINKSKNSFYRGISLNSKYTIAQLYTKVSTGDFSDLYLGDYYSVTIDTVVPSGGLAREEVDLMIAGFDIYYQIGDTKLAKHHLVLIPKVCFFSAYKMNNSLSTSGGYYNSYMHKIVLPCYAKSLSTALGGHLLTFRDMLSNGTNATITSAAGGGAVGGSTSWAYYDCQLALMSEPQIYGTTAFSSGGHDVGAANKHFPVFNHIPIVDPSETKNIWLRGVVGHQEFCVCGKDGCTGFGNATASFGVRPFMLFG